MATNTPPTTFTLNTGARMPAVGLGTWQAPKDEVRLAVEAGLRAGVRHIDAARVYGNEDEIGQALAAVVADGTVSRGDVWITSKLWNTDHHPSRVEKGCRASLEALGVEYLDLYLIHWPLAFRGNDETLFPRTAAGEIDFDTQTSLLDTWAALVELKRKGLVKAIGLCNVSPALLDFVVKSAKSDYEVPSSVQVEYHPLIAPLQHNLKTKCDEYGIVMTAFSPLGNNRSGLPKVIDLPQVQELARKTGHTEAQIAINWCVSKGVCCIPKSVSPHRIESNLRATEFALDPEQLQIVDDLPRTTPSLQDAGRFNIPVNYPAPNGPWPINIFQHPKESAAAYRVLDNGTVEGPAVAVQV